LEQNPIPEDTSRSNTINYICSLHNNVNERLSKPIFPCEKASAYWGGDCGCSASK
jgi:FAD-linked sulfhydryl oxidase